MPVPRLIHPVDVTIEQIDRSATAYDDDAREPVQHAARKTTVTVPGQIKWMADQEIAMHRGGASEGSRGYVLFRKIDLDSAGITLGTNDRLLAQGWWTGEVYVNRIDPLGHYAGQNGATLFKAWFTDRKPAKER